MEFSFSLADFSLDVSPLIPEMRKAHVTFENPPGTVWFKAAGAMGVAGICAVSFTRNAARFKSVYVKPEFRGNGVIYSFFAMADDEARRRGVDRITGFFNKNSVNAAIKYGYS